MKARKRPARWTQPKIKSETEDSLQIKCVVWMEKNNILHYHIPNQGKRSMAQAAKLKRMGMRSGVPDIHIPIPTACHHGAYIELKRDSKAVVSDNQRWWMKALADKGYFVAIATSFDEFVDVVNGYLYNSPQ